MKSDIRVLADRIHTELKWLGEPLSVWTNGEKVEFKPVDHKILCSKWNKIGTFSPNMNVKQILGRLTRKLDGCSIPSSLGRKSAIIQQAIGEEIDGSS